MLSSPPFNNTPFSFFSLEVDTDVAGRREGTGGRWREEGAKEEDSGEAEPLNLQTIFSFITK